MNYCISRGTVTKNKTIVVKIGTSTLTKGTKILSRRVMLGLVQQMAALYEKGKNVIVVSSGAGAAGREILKQPKPVRDMPFKQMLAAIGQPYLMQRWAELFSLFEIPVGQVLLTRSDFSNRQRYLNARDTLQALLHHRVIPIINENDTVATEEIKVGDNDNLSALVSNLVAADLLILLTDQQGLYTADPRFNPDAKLISTVDKIDESILGLAKGSGTSLGTGGMVTKLEAAQLAMQSGTSTVIADSSLPNVLSKIVEGDKLGTFFPAHTTSRESRKRWLLSEKPAGTLFLDEGAVEQLLGKGASLLPVGIVKVAKSFERGAVVQLASREGLSIGVGITHYSSHEIEKLIGAQTGQIEERLGYTCGNEIVHRDNISLLNG